MIFASCFRLRFRGLYFSVLEIFLFQLYCFINYYFRALSFLFLIHRWMEIYMNLESSLKKLKLKPFWLFFIRSFNPAPITRTNSVSAVERLGRGVGLTFSNNGQIQSPLMRCVNAQVRSVTHLRRDPPRRSKTHLIDRESLQILPTLVAWG